MRTKFFDMGVLTAITVLLLSSRKQYHELRQVFTDFPTEQGGLSDNIFKFERFPIRVLVHTPTILKFS
jgi:hypothetical protein